MTHESVLKGGRKHLAGRKGGGGRASRRGITLLEILFSIFVLLSGFLGMAILLLVGAHHWAVGMRLERAGECAKAGFREIEVRDMLRPQTWMRRSASVGWPVDLDPNNSGDWPDDLEPVSKVRVVDDTSGTGQIEPFILDPILIARNRGQGRSRRFPYTAAESDAIRRYTLKSLMYRRTQIKIGLDTVTVLRRLDLLDDPANPDEKPEQAADAMFSWRDDIDFRAPAGDEDGRPQLPPEDELQAEGEYSWMVMVTPGLNENASFANRPMIRDRRFYTASVIVFYKRDTTISTDNSKESPAPERQVAGTMLGGLNLRLTYDDATPSIPGEIIPNQWIMLSGNLKSDGTVPATNAALAIHRWFRVVSVSQKEGSDNVLLTLDGADWPPSSKLQGGASVRVSIADGVIAVYQRTVTLGGR